MKVNWKLYKGCTEPDEKLCPHPYVRYVNEDGACYHKACEGKHVECGKITNLSE